ncbi:hypothetical protein N7528_008869 [Penicillium herquei]|nr:hypothetical protein N7528_008869 [Penicillium herquei]
MSPGKKSSDIVDNWKYVLYAQDAWNKIGKFLSKQNEPREDNDFFPFKKGAFNTNLLMSFTDDSAVVMRFPLPGAVMFPEEKVRNEVAVMKFILDQTANKIPIPVPSVSCWGQQQESPANMGPFIIMDYINHYGNMRDLLESPDRKPGERPVLNPDIPPLRLEFLYRKLAKVLLSLSTLTFDRIGSIKLDHDDGSTWKVSHRPLSYSMNEIVQLGTLPRSKVPSIIHHTASSYFESLAELHLTHLIHQRNDAIESEEDCRRKFVARYLFRKIVQDPQFRVNSQWLFHNKGPFPLWCDDFRPENVLINKEEDIAAVVDWEFTYTAPVGFVHAPPWWLLIEKPEYWPEGLDDWCMEYERRLERFLEVMVSCEREEIRTGRLVESQRLSCHMRDSWNSGDFWIMYAARQNFAFDAIYWQKIDQRFFGPSGCLEVEDVWRERLDLLSSEEKEEMEKYVNMKVKEMETRVLAWEPGQYTLEHMAKLNV